MVCIYCGSATEVKNSRLQRHGNHIWRRRKCKSCGTIFTTRESATLSDAFMVKGASATLTPLNRDKLFLSIYESCRHRPNALTDASALTQTIINQLTQTHHDGVVEREAIVHHAHTTLRRFDAVAATFYAAYHPL